MADIWDENDKWVVTYERGGELHHVSSQQCDDDPGKAPAFGILCIGYPDPKVGWAICGRSDAGYFVWVHEHGAWDAKDHIGFLDALANYPGCVVRFGRGVPDALWYEAVRHHWSHPLKSGALRTEPPKPDA